MTSSPFSSVAQLCPTPCDPMNHSRPGLPVHHKLLEFTQTRVHWVGDAIQASHPLLSPFPPALNLPQHQGLFQWVGCSHQVDKALELQHQSFEWIFKVDFLQDWLILSPCCLRDSQESSLPPIWKHQFFGAQPSLWSNSHICTWLMEKPWSWLDLCWQSKVSAF